jgi:Phage integrase family
MLREATHPPAAVNVLDVSSESMAAFQVFTYGRFWVFTEEWGDFDWANSTMFVKRAIVDGVVDEVKTKYSKAGLPLHQSLAEMLLRWKAQSKLQRDEDWVFSSWRTRGDKPLRATSVLENFIKPAAQRAGLGLIGWHTFRRTFSTLLRFNGEDIKVQQELMRHADIRTTMNLYTQANSDQKRQAHGKIVEMILVNGSAECSPALPQPSGTCESKRRNGGRYRIRTYDFHGVKLTSGASPLAVLGEPRPGWPRYASLCSAEPPG